MRICFSIQNCLDQDMLLSEHFGDSGTFTVYDTDRQALTPHDCHLTLCKGPCHCHLPMLEPRDFDAVICRGIGARAFALMRRARIAVFLTDAPNIREALSEWRTKRLSLAQKGVCRPEFIGRRTEKNRRLNHGSST